MIARRKFLRLIGMSPVAAPAARAALEAEVGRLAGISTLGAPAALYGVGRGPPQANGSSMAYSARRIAAGELLKLGKLPDHVREQLWRNATYVGQLDPDLAAKRSWSMSVKILTQRQRNFERQLEAIHHGSWMAKAEETFHLVTGWEWPW